MRVLVTGASGFIGRAVVAQLTSDSTHQIRAAFRRRVTNIPPDVEFVLVDLAPGTDWSEAVSGIDVIVHTAARVHVVHEVTSDPLAAFRRINVDGTLTMARQAARAGVRRFIFLSSIKVNGEETVPGKPFRAGDTATPIDAYGISKLEAELGLTEIAATTTMEVVIIRPSLVYGPGVKANFLAMMCWLHKGLPMPLEGIHNQRSFIALDNLVSLILLCITHPAAANHVLLAADGEDLSTSELLKRLGLALGKPARLFAVPVAALRGVLTLVGMRRVSQRLCGSLQVDISGTRELLGWAPFVTVDEGLRATARHFLSTVQR
jgi:UDP-N-acetyl-alpha-D-quinovosamine dehydrogenase